MSYDVIAIILSLIINTIDRSLVCIDAARKIDEK